MLPITAQPPRSIHTSQPRKLAWPTHPLSGEREDQRQVAAGGEMGRGRGPTGSKGRECTCSRCFSFQLHWLRQPAKETQNTSISQGGKPGSYLLSPHQAPPQHPPSDRGENWHKPLLHSCRLGKSAPSGKRESGHPHPLTPHPRNLLGPLNPAEHPLPTQTQQPQGPGDSVKSK